MSENKKETLGRDISRPVDKIVLDGQDYKLQFDNTCFRVAEDVYELYYHRPLNFAEIAQQLAGAKLGAIMAIMYGALTAAGTEMPWTEFNKSFSLASLPGIQELLVKNVESALPEAKGDKQGAGPQ